MDSNERLKFLNRLNDVTGDQAREVLKQMAINCNARQTTVARALKSAVDQHAPIIHPEPAATISSPPDTAPSTTRKKTKSRQKAGPGDINSGEGGCDDDIPASKKQTKQTNQKHKRGDINSDPNIGRLILEKSVPRRGGTQHADPTGDSNRQGTSSSNNGRERKKATVMNKNSELQAKRGPVKQEPEVAIDSTSESGTSDSDSSDSDSPDNDSSGDDSSDDFDSDSSDSDSSDSDDSLDMFSERGMYPKGRAVHTSNEQHAQGPPAQAAWRTTVWPQNNDSTDSVKRRQVPRQLGLDSTTLAGKRKLTSAEGGENVDSLGNSQENKKPRRDLNQMLHGPTEDRTCRRCHQVFATKTTLFEHLDETSHFVTKPVPIPVNHSIISTPNVKIQPDREDTSRDAPFYSARNTPLYPSRYRPPRSQPFRRQDQPESTNVPGKHADPEIKEESDDNAHIMSSPLQRTKYVSGRAKSMPPPRFVREPNSFPRGPTPAPLAVARQDIYATGAESLPNLTHAPVRVEDVASQSRSAAVAPVSQVPVQVIGTRYLCKYCKRWFENVSNTSVQPPCRHHTGK